MKVWSGWAAIVTVAVVGIAMLGPEAAAAGADTLGTAATNIKGETAAYGQLAMAVFALVGAVVAGIGIIKLINAKKTNEPIGPSVGMIFGGAILTVLITVINMTTQTTVRADATSIQGFGEAD